MRLGWMEIALIVVLVIILFGHNKIPGMMKNLADGLNVFKKEIKTNTKTEKKSTQTKKPVKKVVKKK
ncbi:MAG: twin-arginine translocase TatA/TatE family subunit [Alphaproteobacteria bacterium]|nr:twin-arginine translocase TatA/TatE family subunit [Alphaproteobacteria bacterium]